MHPLKQHRCLCISCRDLREEVNKGQLIAAADYEDSANIHASIDGVIEEIGSTHIFIKSAGLE